ncbi:MAG: nucleoside-diphosphate sugar epimerase/dehydratase [Candidatus Omnitrophica bacterium]|nr:nucleoside-diphosphate sugar epimerase/dehydratase [Candidatus Omnitrophota bacterium]
MKTIIKDWRRLLLMFGDMIVIALSLYLAFVTRFWRFNLPIRYLFIYYKILPMALVIYLFSFLRFGLYHGTWRFAGLHDLSSISKSILAGTVSLVVASFLIVGLRDTPRSVFILFTVYLVVGVGILRIAARFYRELGHPFGLWLNPDASRTLILGAGDAGEAVLRNLQQQPNKSTPIGFLDDDFQKQGTLIHGVKVLGVIDKLPEILRIFRVKEVFVAIPNFLGEKMRWVAEVCQKAGVKSRTIPRMADILAGRVQLDRLRLIGMEDLLNRRITKIENERIREILSGKRVLVTGAGGSIGSELCRQILGYQPAYLILLEQNETGLFYITNELAQKFPGIKLRPVVGDICHQSKMARIFADYQPEIIFHAAAYKHVPMMEENPDEAIRNNVFGTKILVDLALENGISHFIMLSTDKAVNPAGVMGTTKRLAEMYLQSRQAGGANPLKAVRFGNVLGSAGSVVPVFKQQIDDGGPVTVTHPEIKRFFMTIPEAVELILFAAAVSQNSAIFVLEMGDLIKIKDLAWNLISLAGLTPEKDIKIIYTGLRPGEKLYEEFYYEKNEILTETDSPAVKAVQSKRLISAEAVDRALAGLQALLDISTPPDKLREALKEVLRKLEE